MSDEIVKAYRCTSCSGAFERTPDDEIPAPSLNSRGVETEDAEFVCNDCCARLAGEHQRLMSERVATRRRA